MAGDRELWFEEVCSRGFCSCDCERCDRREEVLEAWEKMEVVRCKDCKHFEASVEVCNPERNIEWWSFNCNWLRRGTSPMGFCYWGSRRAE